MARAVLALCLTGASAFVAPVRAQRRKQDKKRCSYGRSRRLDGQTPIRPLAQLPRGRSRCAFLTAACCGHRAWLEVTNRTRAGGSPTQTRAPALRVVEAEIVPRRPPARRRWDPAGFVLRRLTPPHTRRRCAGKSKSIVRNAGRPGRAARAPRGEEPGRPRRHRRDGALRRQRQVLGPRRLHGADRGLAHALVPRGRA